VMLRLLLSYKNSLQIAHMNFIYSQNNLFLLVGRCFTTLLHEEPHATVDSTFRPLVSSAP